MAYDDEPDDPSGPSGSPLPPEDRLWRHPSEVGGSGPPRGPGDAAVEPVPAPPSGWSAAAVVAVAGLAGAALAVGVIATTGALGSDVVERTVVERVALPPAVSTPASLPAGGAAPAPVSEVVGPAVVSVEVDGESGPRQGTGVVFRDDGLLVTNARLLRGTDTATVVLRDGRRLGAEVVGADPVTDVGLVRVADADGLPVAVLGTAEGLSPGEPALVLARPPGPGARLDTVAGVVQGVDGRAERSGAPPLHGLIETDVARTDAAGGALVDGRGALVGLVATGVSEGGTVAVPVDVVHDVALEILESGRARHVWLGVEGSDVDPDTAEELDVAGGALVRSVVAESPAARAGLATDDVIVAVDGEPVSSMSDLVVALRDHEPGDEVELAYRRDGDAGRCEAVLAEREPVAD